MTLLPLEGYFHLRSAVYVFGRIKLLLDSTYSFNFLLTAPTVITGI